MCVVVSSLRRGPFARARVTLGRAAGGTSDIPGSCWAPGSLLVAVREHPRTGKQTLRAPAWPLRRARGPCAAAACGGSAPAPRARATPCRTARARRSCPAPRPATWPATAATAARGKLPPFSHRVWSVHGRGPVVACSAHQVLEPRVVDGHAVHADVACLLHHAALELGRGDLEEERSGKLCAWGWGGPRHAQWSPVRPKQTGLRYPPPHLVEHAVVHVVGPVVVPHGARARVDLEEPRELRPHRLVVNVCIECARVNGRNGVHSTALLLLRPPGAEAVHFDSSTQRRNFSLGTTVRRFPDCGCSRRSVREMVTRGLLRACGRGGANDSRGPDCRFTPNKLLRARERARLVSVARTTSSSTSEPYRRLFSCVSALSVKTLLGGRAILLPPPGGCCHCQVLPNQCYRVWPRWLSSAQRARRAQLSCWFKLLTDGPRQHLQVSVLELHITNVTSRAAVVKARRTAGRAVPRDTLERQQAESNTPEERRKKCPPNSRVGARGRHTGQNCAHPPPRVARHASTNAHHHRGGDGIHCQNHLAARRLFLLLLCERREPWVPSPRPRLAACASHGKTRHHRVRVLALRPSPWRPLIAAPSPTHTHARNHTHANTRAAPHPKSVHSSRHRHVWRRTTLATHETAAGTAALRPGGPPTRLVSSSCSTRSTRAAARDIRRLENKGRTADGTGGPGTHHETPPRDTFVGRGWGALACGRRKGQHRWGVEGPGASDAVQPPRIRRAKSSEADRTRPWSARARRARPEKGLATHQHRALELSTAGKAEGGPSVARSKTHLRVIRKRGQGKGSHVSLPCALRRRWWAHKRASWDLRAWTS